MGWGIHRQTYVADINYAEQLSEHYEHQTLMQHAKSSNPEIEELIGRMQNEYVMQEALYKNLQ